MEPLGLWVTYSGAALVALMQSQAQSMRDVAASLQEEIDQRNGAAATLGGNPDVVALIHLAQQAAGLVARAGDLEVLAGLIDATRSHHLGVADLMFLGVLSDK